MTVMPCQQTELYAAERGVSRGREFTSLTEVEEWVNSFRDSWWWQRDYAMVRFVEVEPAADERRGSAGGWFPDLGCGRMGMARVHWCEQFVIHELAHVLAEAHWGSESHDPLFARCYANLTYHMRGSEAWVELQTAFDLAGIDYAQ